MVNFNAVDTPPSVTVHGRHLLEVDAADSLGLVANHGVFEPCETALCQSLIGPGDRVLDIGANIGYYTLLFCDLVSPSGSVTAIEPDPENFARLQRNLSAQVADGRARLHRVALGSEACTARLYQADESAGLHRMYSSVCCNDNGTDVAVITGDSLDLAPLDFIKIDIEGYEPAALRGLARTLENSPNLKILSEFSPLSLWEAGFSPIAFLEEMRSLGLRLVTHGDGRWNACGYDEFIQALHKVPSSAADAFIAEIRRDHQGAPVQVIGRQAVAFLDRLGYTRPMLENVLFVSAGAWPAVCEALQLGDEPAAAAASPYRELSFPLNVYAHALLLHEGQAEYLHYGLFKDGNPELRAAQQYSTELLLSQLPPPPCKVLEVGAGLGTTLALLTGKGYEIHGITPDPKQVAQIRRRFGDGVSVSCEPLESFQGAAGSYDVVLFQESAQYIDPLTIYDKVFDLLAPSGSLIIIDEFALRRAEAGVEGLHLRADMLSLAGRFGFETVCDIDLSSLAAPTLDYLLRVTTLHRERLIGDLALDPDCLLRLDESNRIYREKYAAGRYGYGLMHFRKGASPKWRLRSLQRRDLPEFFGLFEQSFGHPMTSAMWEWKYGGTDSRELCAWHEGKMAGHYGGMPRQILFFGQPRTAVQIGDVMVSSDQRGALTRSGPFFRMAATFLEQYIGYGKPYLVGFGFPNERAMKVAEKLGLYAEVGRIVEIRWEPSSTRPALFTRLCALDAGDGPQVDELWRRMAGDLDHAIAGVRDWDYVQRRYLAHPHQQYQLWMVRNRFGGQPRGLMVFRHDPEGCELVDIVAPLAEIPLLIAQARRYASRSGSRLYCRVTENFSPLFAATGGSAHDIGIRIPANVWSAGPAPEMLQNHWWLMSGDMDFR